METVLAVLTLVVIIAAEEIWRVLRDIRDALQARNGLTPGGQLSVLEETLLWAKDISKAIESTANELGRIGDILGGILADMPSRSPSPQESRPVSNYPSAWDRLRVSEEKKLKVVDRRACPADCSRNPPSSEAK
jgi:hypothetical protein